MAVMANDMLTDKKGNVCMAVAAQHSASVGLLL